MTNTFPAVDQPGRQSRVAGRDGREPGVLVIHGNRGSLLNLEASLVPLETAVSWVMMAGEYWLMNAEHDGAVSGASARGRV